MSAGDSLGAFHAIVSAGDDTAHHEGAAEVLEECRLEAQRSLEQGEPRTAADVADDIVRKLVVAYNLDWSC